MEPWQVGLITAAAGIAFGVGGMFLYLYLTRQGARRQAEQIVREGEREKERIEKEAGLKAKEESLRRREEFEKNARRQENEFKQLERRLLKRRDALEKKAEQMQRREQQIEETEGRARERLQEADESLAEYRKVLSEEKETLHRMSGLSEEEATQLVLDRLEKELADEVSVRIRRSQETARERADEEARRLISMAFQRVAAPHVSSSVVATVALPNEEMKGRIIGREGRNIRTFEQATGIDVIVDDTPGVILLSGFDGLRREMARRAMEKLITDGRIHPTRIEEVVEQTRREMEEAVIKHGKQACYELDIHDLHPKAVELLGRLAFRTSYGQNCLDHSIEVARLCEYLAAELRLDARLARRCGLLHDVGKAVDQEMEGSHPQIGAELLKRFNERPEVVDSALRHHEDLDANYPFTVVAAAADAISAARPGARGESLERYVKRLEKLEQIATAFNGVESAYAIQAGRELRVIANSTKIDDRQALVLARDVAKEIEKEMTYPGEIRVTVIRETRVVEYAR